MELHRKRRKVFINKSFVRKIVYICKQFVGNVWLYTVRNNRVPVVLGCNMYFAVPGVTDRVVCSPMPEFQLLGPETIGKGQ